ncbi:unnamed protein product [Acanthoscelides obtectus]|uniref:Uncharacterized protein n=1 Tax=Acanthoscelides obtectus TaxID=200917 RepID=A0A9P0QHM7_ACAOB|nr:unnamed protein product [Acanthoscelides obtectus]CAK1683720.1 hypothetical protein AOBTE_LOCUS34426 [Acanthoscelides obtectus]
MFYDLTGMKIMLPFLNLLTINKGTSQTSSRMKYIREILHMDLNKGMHYLGEPK